MPAHEQPVFFTKEQFKSLIRIVYLGNWFANANRTGTEGDPHHEEFNEIEEYVFSNASKFGLVDLVDKEASDERWYPTRELEESLDDIHTEYDEETFWDELFFRMSDRDFLRAYPEKEIRKMPMLERFQKEEPFRKKWDNEINEHGIERLDIKAE